MGVIEINKLTKYYGKSLGIIDIDLEIEKGEIFGFIGPNGAGKSTTIRTLLNLIYPTSGSAKIFGLDVVKDSKEIKKNIGFMPSEVNYYDYMRVRELLYYSARFYGKNCDERIDALSKMFSLDLNKKIYDLSFGNRKKISILQSLIHKPKLLILDEPTSGLDPLMQAKYFEILNEENARGTTIFFSSHVLNEVQKLCKRVAIIKDGRIIKVENIENITGKQFKKIKLDMKNIEQIKLLNTNEIYNMSNNENICNFLYSGDINNILKEISNMELNNLTIEEPTLEEIFMHYYQ